MTVEEHLFFYSSIINDVPSNITTKNEKYKKNTWSSWKHDDQWLVSTLTRNRSVSPDVRGRKRKKKMSSVGSNFVFVFCLKEN